MTERVLVRDISEVSAEITDAWRELIRHDLMPTYQAMSTEKIVELRRGKGELPPGQEPITRYLRAVGEFAPLPPKSLTTK